MNKQRLEAFSDGVYAIVITLLILEIKIPEVDPAVLGPALVQLIPQLLTYVLSFFIVGLYWHAHHHVSVQVKQVNSPFIWLNLVWLLFVSVLPFPTALLGRYALQPIPLTIYGINLILVNLIGFVIVYYLRHHPELCVTLITSAALRAQVPIYVVVNAIYAAAIAAAWYIPWLSYTVYILLLFYMMSRYARRANPVEAEISHV